MKFCRFLPFEPSAPQPAPPLYGLLEREQVREISGPPWHSWSHGTRTWPVTNVRLLAPVDPGKIVCVGRNYAAHAAEFGNEVPKEPLIFLKRACACGRPVLLAAQGLGRRARLSARLYLPQ